MKAANHRSWLVALALVCCCCGDGSTEVDSTDGVLCGDCHGTPPSSGRHELHVKMLECNSCHACVVDGTRTMLDATRHDDGSKDVCNDVASLTYDAATSTCSNAGCHQPKTW